MIEHTSEGPARSPLPLRAKRPIAFCGLLEEPASLASAGGSVVRDLEGISMSQTHTGGRPYPIDLPDLPIPLPDPMPPPKPKPSPKPTGPLRRFADVDGDGSMDAIAGSS